MDGRNFDDLTRDLSSIGSRRAVLGGFIALLAIPLDVAARRKARGKARDGKRERVQAEEPNCWRQSACTPSKGANFSRCDLRNSTSFNGINCTGCNVSRANLRGASALGTNFTWANLSGACLVDADFSGATFAKNTNLANAIFCNTTMPNGFVDDSGCGSGTECCPTCVAENEVCEVGSPRGCCGAAACTEGTCQTCIRETCETLGLGCGSWSDGCGGTVDCGCGAGQTCCGIECVNLSTDTDNCGECGTSCGANESCLGTCVAPSALFCSCSNGTATAVCAAGACTASNHAARCFTACAGSAVASSSCGVC